MRLSQRKENHPENSSDKAVKEKKKNTKDEVSKKPLKKVIKCDLQWNYSYTCSN